MGGRKKRESGGKGEETSGRKPGIPGEELEGNPDTGKKGGRSDGKQHRRAYQPCAVSEDEFPSDGLERGGGVEGVEAEDLLEERRKDRRVIEGYG